MTSFRPADSKREEFRNYLEKAGVLDSLTRILVSLYEEPEKPNYALDFLKQHLNVAQVSEVQQKVEQLQDENKELKAKIQQENRDGEQGSES